MNPISYPYYISSGLKWLVQTILNTCAVQWIAMLHNYDLLFSLASVSTDYYYLAFIYPLLYYPEIGAYLKNGRKSRLQIVVR